MLIWLLIFSVIFNRSSTGIAKNKAFVIYGGASISIVNPPTTTSDLANTIYILNASDVKSIKAYGGSGAGVTSEMTYNYIDETGITAKTATLSYNTEGTITIESGHTLLEVGSNAASGYAPRIRFELN